MEHLELLLTLRRHAHCCAMDSSARPARCNEDTDAPFSKRSNQLWPLEIDGDATWVMHSLRMRCASSRRTCDRPRTHRRGDSHGSVPQRVGVTVCWFRLQRHWSTRLPYLMPKVDTTKHTTHCAGSQDSKIKIARFDPIYITSANTDALSSPDA